ncbi:hypothetical protein SLS60_002219 [Paraconiothyrium brasiliense]|uniref:Tyrosinase copper-binding domain-containing protein n=1 Tax=Paraconiothyrium brasiliense TaxID=300254 RepID=A0ABR3S1J3_9PLEO
MNTQQKKLQAIAIGIADGFSDPSYRDAATRLRLPFWDWAQAVAGTDPAFPAVLSTPMISVTLQDGSREETDNPLYDYSFHPLENSQINSTDNERGMVDLFQQQETADLGYTYPELLDSPGNATLISRINALYRDSGLAASNTVPKDFTDNTEYIVQVIMPASVHFSYDVLLFLGDIQVHPESQHSLIGKTSSLIATKMQKSASTSSMVVLNENIMTEVADGHASNTEMEEYLRSSLKWCLEVVRTVLLVEGSFTELFQGGKITSKSDVPDIKVALMNTRVERASSIFELDRWIGGFDILGAIN